jgi:hypothetical protein
MLGSEGRDYGDSLLNPVLDRGRDALNHRNKASKGSSDERGLSKVSP